MAGQNIYDDETFFAGYHAMREAGSGLNEALEQPALHALLPAVGGSDVIDLGCGGGGLCRELASSGANSVLGIDPSAQMLALAHERSPEPHLLARVQLRQGFAEELDLPAECADLVVSSLALHYVEDLAGLIARAASWLRPGGMLLFSIEHPVVTAAPGRACEHGWVVADYAQQGPRHTQWYVENVTKYHRTSATIVAAVLAAGLALTALDEPAPTDSDLAGRPDLRIHRDRPALLLVQAVKANT